MKSSRLSILLITLAVTIFLGLLLKLGAESSKSSAQDVGQSLDIARHADEPFGIVDLKVGDRSLRKNISVKYRNGDENREGLDKVDFRGKDDWCKLIHVTLRNISGRPIVALQAYLYIKPPGSEVCFGANLERTLQQIVEPGAEIELTVDEGSWARAQERMKRQGADGRSATVMLSVENVAFSDDLMWDRGRLHQRDPQNRSKWSVIVKKKRQARWISSADSVQICRLEARRKLA